MIGLESGSTIVKTDYSGSVYSIEAAKLYRDLEAGEQTEVNNL